MWHIDTLAFLSILQMLEEQIEATTAQLEELLAGSSSFDTQVSIALSILPCISISTGISLGMSLPRSHCHYFHVHLHPDPRLYVCLDTGYLSSPD
jgi:hypothetical protein